MQSMNGAGQIFTLDLLFAVVIMAAALLSLTYYSGGKMAPARDDVERLESLMTPGIPVDWNETTVKLVGFTNADGSFNETKIQLFESQSPQVQKRWLGIRSNFTMRFIANNTTVACPSCGSAPLKYDDVTPLRRYALLNTNITRMEVILYE